jgi:hypothetical protein
MSNQSNGMDPGEREERVRSGDNGKQLDWHVGRALDKRGGS